MQSRQMLKRHFRLFLTVTNVLTKREKREYYCHSMPVYGYILSSDIYSVARAISISGLGDHIAISGCRLLQSFWEHFCARYGRRVTFCELSYNNTYCVSDL